MLALENAAILDVERGEIAGDKLILIEGERILEISDDRRSPATARHVDLQGRIVMPGLCDAHVHVTASTADFAELARLAPTYVAAHAGNILSGMLERGFTTVRDAGGADHGLARALSERLLIGPRLLFCEKALSQTGGHGDMRQPGETAPATLCGCGLGYVVDGVDGVRRACREIVRKGGHHIKLMASGGVSSPTDRISSTQFSVEEMSAAVEEAEAAGIYCMAHAYTPAAVTRAVRSGVRSIEHGNLIDRETAKVIFDHQAFLVPTLITYDALMRHGASVGLSNSMIGKLSEVFNAGRAALEIARAEGVEIVFGSDLLGALHEFQLDEFAIRGEIQSPLELIRSATINAARLFDMEGDIGSVTPGALADILVLDESPLTHPELLTKLPSEIRMLIARGQIVKSTL